MIQIKFIVLVILEDILEKADVLKLNEMLERFEKERQEALKTMNICTKLSFIRISVS